MSKNLSGAAVPRHLVFVLGDGTFVVQWDNTRIQELLSGRYRLYNHERDFGHPVTDYELNQLKAAGRVEHYNRIYVWLFSLPETGRFETPLREMERDRHWAYYINTTMPKAHVETVRQLLAQLGLENDYSASIRSELVAILGRDERPFSSLKEAEQAQRHLQARAPIVFNKAVVAFVEAMNNQRQRLSQTQRLQTSELLDLSSIIASQTDTLLTAGKRALLICQDGEARTERLQLLKDMKFIAVAAQDAQSALLLLEETPTDLLVVDTQLPDMHVWELLQKVREIVTQHKLSVVVTASESATPNDQTFGLNVAKVDAYVTQPVGLRRLRHNIYAIFQRKEPHA